jgi:hypothetical protein
MHKRLFLLSLAAGLLACSFGTMNAMAGSVSVTEDGGTFNFTLTASGHGTFTIAYSDELLTTINKVAIPTGLIAAELPSSTVHTVTSTTTSGPFTSYTLTQATPSQENFGVGSGAILTAALQYNLTAGGTFTGFLGLTGNTTGVPSTLLETSATTPTIYNFSPFLNGGEITQTYTKTSADFAGVLARGGTITGTGAFTDQAVVPEPTSVALLGIGVSCFFVFRRCLKSNVVV